MGGSAPLGDVGVEGEVRIEHEELPALEVEPLAKGGSADDRRAEGCGRIDEAPLLALAHLHEQPVVREIDRVRSVSGPSP